MSKLLELADRCEAATGPDRELDSLAHQAQGFALEFIQEPVRLAHLRHWVNTDGRPTGWLEGSPGYPPRYTASLDAAMTLVPEGASALVSSPGSYDMKPWARCHMPKQGPIPPAYQGEAATPALALCAAALRARASIEGGENA